MGWVRIKNKVSRPEVATKKIIPTRDSIQIEPIVSLKFHIHIKEAIL
jgi:hypothetical protein